MKSAKLLVSRKEIEQKAMTISELTGINVRVHTVKGNINIELSDKNDEKLRNKKVFTGDIDECYLFIEGILSFLEIIGRNKEERQ